MRDIRTWPTPLLRWWSRATFLYICWAIFWLGVAFVTLMADVFLHDWWGVVVSVIVMLIHWTVAVLTFRARSTARETLFFRGYD